MDFNSDSDLANVNIRSHIRIWIIFSILKIEFLIPIRRCIFFYRDYIWVESVKHRLMWYIFLSWVIKISLTHHLTYYVTPNCFNQNAMYFLGMFFLIMKNSKNLSCPASVVNLLYWWFNFYIVKKYSSFISCKNDFNVRWGKIIINKITSRERERKANKWAHKLWFVG